MGNFDEITKGMSNMKKNRQLIFYILMLIWPITQFLVFYVGVNLNSFLMAFKTYDQSISAFKWVGLDNFKRIWLELTEYSTLSDALVNSLIVWFFTIFLGTVLAVFFSYYIYKKFRMHGFFKVVLFLPSILPAIILTMIFKTFVNEALPELLALIGIQIGPLMTLDAVSKFPMAAFFTIWIGFGTQVLLYTGTMEQISPSVIEAAQLDGVKPMRELFSIVLPDVIPAINTFLVTGIATIFVNQANLLSFYGFDLFSSDRTIGYYLFMLVNHPDYGKSEYGYASAIGLCCSAIAIPLTWIVRHYLTKLEDN